MDSLCPWSPAAGLRLSGTGTRTGPDVSPAGSATALPGGRGGENRQLASASSVLLRAGAKTQTPRQAGCHPPAAPWQAPSHTMPPVQPLPAWNDHKTKFRNPRGIHAANHIHQPEKTAEWSPGLKPGCKGHRGPPSQERLRASLGQITRPTCPQAQGRVCTTPATPTAAHSSLVTRKPPKAP